ncbi:GNAT family N-acetyltransferase [Serratia ficaria]|uniref:GNAT family N-acetyltransferase n=1 Tax=Serratia ficaria TaxID=61651 RepID=UPI002184058B|nr:GNAT family N-acetyltransferase [Serratia ficaria]CAI2417154.1 Uncharacterized N-acetyltransferase YycN [Serratia ficaria]
MIELREMTEQERERYRAHGVEEYAKDLARSLPLDMEQARVEAEASFSRGLAAPGQRLVCAWQPALQASVGIVWYAIETRTFGRQLFIYDLEVAPVWRGQGYGEQILNAVLAAARAAGAQYAELTVFNDNPTAARLYARIGFRAVTTRMRRRL